jgi:acetyltransferase-like isoleucine patch superfamily enzyme
MTIASRILALFPAFVVVTTLTAVVVFLLAPGVFTAAAIPATIYGLPLAAHRVHAARHPVGRSVEKLVSSDYSPWWASHQFQWVFIAFPVLETLLRAVPGLFSLWLRAWGAQVGRGVYWTPTLTVLDRGLLEIGDHVVFGHRVSLSSHIIRPTKRGDDLLCVIQPIRIGSGAFIGAGSVLGPGTVVGAGTLVEAGSVLARGR